MDTNENSVIDDIYYAFLKKRNELNRLVKKNQEEIQETEALLKSLMETDVDMKYFSPRNTEDIYKNEISSAKDKIEHLIQENEMSISQMEELSKKIEELKIFKDQEAHQIELSNALLDVQEMDRQRIARELHDTTVQNLAHLIHEIELSSLYIDKDPIQAKLELESCSQTLKKAIDEIRDTVFDLRPMSFDDLGFNQCIENLIDTLKTQNPEFTFISDVDIFDTKVEKDQKNYQLFLVSVYRIVHEALLNAVKHSKGSKVELSIKKTDDHLVIKVIDNGKGFVKEEGCSADKHFGISVMQERVFLLGGIFEINSNIGEGTRIFISFPYNFSS